MGTQCHGEINTFDKICVIIHELLFWTIAKQSLDYGTEKEKAAQYVREAQGNNSKNSGLIF